MKVIIDGYEVEIKAKSPFNKRYNKDDTLSILNTLNRWQIAKARYLEQRHNETGKQCYKNCADNTYKRVSELHEFIASFGTYDNL